MRQKLGNTRLSYKQFDKYLEANQIYFRFSKRDGNLLAHFPTQIELNTFSKNGIQGYSLGIPKGNLQDKFENTTKIRWVKPLVGDPFPMEALVDLLSVDFVQAKQGGAVLVWFQ